MKMDRIKYFVAIVFLSLATMAVGQNQDTDGDDKDFIDETIDKAKEKTTSAADSLIYDIVRGVLGSDSTNTSIANDLSQVANGYISDAYDNINDRVTQLLAQTQHPRPELQYRHEACRAIEEKVREEKRLVTSIRDIVNGKRECPLPVGIKNGSYALYISKITTKDTDMRNWIEACAFIKFGDSGQELAFDGKAVLEGENGIIDVDGKLELIGNVERPLGSHCSVIFKEGTTIHFGCEGIDKIYAKMAFVVKDNSIYGVDDNGKSTGRICFDFEAEFVDFDDFYATLNVDQRFRIGGVDEMTFVLKGLTLDQSLTKTPSTVQFPENYFKIVVDENEELSDERKKEIEEEEKNNKEAWRGVAISHAEVVLSGFFGSMGEDSEMKFNLDKAIFDGKGFSGNGEAKDIIRDSSIDPNKWCMSINDLKIDMLKGKIEKLCFEGKLNVPPFGEASTLKYKADYESAQKTFLFDAELTKKVDFPIWRANLELDPSSNVEIKISKGKISPKVKLNGKLSVDANVGLGSARFEMHGVNFENLVFQKDKPYVSIGSFDLIDANFQTPSIAGFQLSISEIEPVIRNVINQRFSSQEIYNESQQFAYAGQSKYGPSPIPVTPIVSVDTSYTEVGLSVKTDIQLNEQFKGSTKITLVGDAQTYTFKSVKMDSVGVDYHSDAFSLKGHVMFKDDDEIYGKGFRGRIDMSLLHDKYKVSAVGVFGKKDGSRYFMADAFLETSPENGIKIAPALTFFGLGGGLYYGMQHSTKENENEFGKSLSGVCYVPDKKVGLGFMARTKFGLLAAPDMLNAEAGFEMQFNKNWGVNFVAMTGEARIMYKTAELTSLKDALKKKFGENVANRFSGDMSNEVSNNFNDFIDNEFGEKPTLGGPFTAKMAVQLDFANDIYNADMETYLKWGILEGIGPEGKMGSAKAYFETGDNDKKWYVRIGTPSDPNGLKLLNIAETKSYFMMGIEVPDVTPPPAEVLGVLKKYESTVDKNQAVLNGKGIAFGSSFSQTLDAKVMPFYAYLALGIGSDMVLKNYGPNAHCAGSLPPIGIDGWFATAQAWAYVKADVGMYFKLFRKNKKFSIAKAETAAVLKGSGPNPIYLAGSIGGKFSILGGLVKGKFELPFSVGEKCDIRGGSPFGEMEVIKQLTPSESATDVNVFIAPQLVLNMPVDEEMQIEDEDKVKWTYKVNLDEFSVARKDDGAVLSGAISKKEDMRVCTIDLDEPLESQTSYVVHAVVSFQRKNKYGKWEVLTDDDGKTKIVEERKIEFTSGNRPNYILPEHILCSYPADGQYNFFSNEYDKAYLATSVNYSYLFRPANEKGEGIPSGYEQKLRLVEKQSGKTLDSKFTFQEGSKSGGVNGAKFYVETSLNNLNLKQDVVYNIAIINEPKSVASSFSNIETTEQNVESDGSDITLTTHEATSDLAILETTEICSADFRTSKYKTFREKMDNMEAKNISPIQIVSNTYSMNSDLEEKSASPEMFDCYEYLINDEAANLIQIVVDYENTPWYVRGLKPFMYGNTSLQSVFKGMTPPQNSDMVTIITPNTKVRVEEDFVEVAKYARVKNASSYYVYEDFKSKSTELADMIRLKRVSETSELKNFLSANDIPKMYKGENGLYPLLFNYTLPGFSRVTTSYRYMFTYK